MKKSLKKAGETIPLLIELLWRSDPNLRILLDSGSVTVDVIPTDRSFSITDALRHPFVSVRMLTMILGLSI